MRNCGQPGFWSVQEATEMADQYGVPQPGCAEDYQQFMLGLYDLIEDAKDGSYSSDGIKALIDARSTFLREFETSFPGYGKGRAVWPLSR